MGRLRDIVRFETRAHLRGFLLWAGVGVLTWLLVFTGADSWELAPSPLLLKMVGSGTPFFFLLAAFVTLNGTSREERAGFADVFHTLPVGNATIYGGKLLAAAACAGIYLGLILLTAAIVAVWKGSVDGQFWQVTLVVIVEALLAILSGIAVAGFLSAAIGDYRTRYVAALIWLVATGLLGGVSLSYGWHEVLGLGLLNVGDTPHCFSLAHGFYPDAAGIWRQGLVQLTFAFFLLVWGRYLFQRHRQSPGVWAGRSVALALMLFVAAYGLYAYQWKQWRSLMAAEASYYLGGTGALLPDWQSVGGTTSLLPTGEEEPAFRVTAYDITLVLPQEDGDASATVVLAVTNSGEERLFFTLTHAMHVKSVEYHFDAQEQDSRTWREATWQRVGDFLSVTVPERAGAEGNVALRMKYAIAAEQFWRGVQGRQLMQFAGDHGAYLNARLGWYPLAGGWHLGTAATMISRPVKASYVLPGLQALDRQEAHRHLLHAEFRLRVKTAPDQLVVTNLSPQGAGSNEWGGHADGVSVYVAPMSTFTAPGLEIAAPKQALRNVEVVYGVFEALQGFYSDLLGIDLPPIRVTVVPRWLDRTYSQWVASRTDHVRVSTLLGNTAAWREEEMAIVLRDAERWMVAGQPRGRLLVWASQSLHAAIHKALWSGMDAQGDYTCNPVVEGAVQYLSTLWLEHALGADGPTEYRLALQHYRPQAELGSQMAQVVVRLDEERQRGGGAAVGLLLRQLMTANGQGELSWQTWVQLTQ